MLTKNKVLETINNLLDRFSIDDLIDRIILLQKIETGEDQSENGNLLSEEEIDKKI
jgi:hypothetical protein